MNVVESRNYSPELNEAGTEDRIALDGNLDTCITDVFFDRGDIGAAEIGGLH